MFGLGLWEIGVVLLLAVMLFPPTELPKLARSIARVYGQVRRTAEDFRNQIMHDEDLRAPLDEVRSAYNDARWQVGKIENEAREQIVKAQQDARVAASSVTGAGAVAAAFEDDDDDDDDDDELFDGADALMDEAMNEDGAEVEAEIEAEIEPPSSAAPEHPSLPAPLLPPLPKSSADSRAV